MLSFQHQTVNRSALALDRAILSLSQGIHHTHVLERYSEVRKKVCKFYLQNVWKWDRLKEGCPSMFTCGVRDQFLTFLGEFFLLFSSDWPVGAGVVGWGWGLLAPAQAALSTCLGLCFLGIQPREGAQCQGAMRLLLLVILLTHQSTQLSACFSHTR